MSRGTILVEFALLNTALLLNEFSTQRHFVTAFVVRLRHWQDGFVRQLGGGKSSVSLLIPLASSGLGSPRTKRHLERTPQAITLIFYLGPATPHHKNKNVLQVSQSSCLRLRTFVVSCEVPRIRNFPDFGSGCQYRFYAP